MWFYIFLQDSDTNRIKQWSSTGDRFQLTEPSYPARDWIPKLRGSKRKYCLIRTIQATEKKANNWDFNDYQYHQHHIIMLDK